MCLPIATELHHMVLQRCERNDSGKVEISKRKVQKRKLNLSLVNLQGEECVFSGGVPGKVWTNHKKKGAKAPCGNC